MKQKRIKVTLYREFWRPDADDSNEGDWETENLTTATVATKAQAEAWAIKTMTERQPIEGSVLSVEAEEQELESDHYGNYWCPTGAMCWWRGTIDNRDEQDWSPRPKTKNTKANVLELRTAPNGKGYLTGLGL